MQHARITSISFFYLIHPHTFRYIHKTKYAPSKKRFTKNTVIISDPYFNTWQHNTMRCIALITILHPVLKLRNKNMLLTLLWDRGYNCRKFNGHCTQIIYFQMLNISLYMVYKTCICLLWTVSQLPLVESRRRDRIGRWLLRNKRNMLCNKLYYAKYQNINYYLLCFNNWLQS